MATKKAPVTVTFEKEKDTKNTTRYKEVNDTDKRDVVGTLYVLKTAVEKLGSPEKISVTISAG